MQANFINNILFLICKLKVLTGFEIQLGPAGACKPCSKSMRPTITPNGKVTFEVTGPPMPRAKKKLFFFFTSVIISDFCTPHCNFDVPLIMPAGTLN